MTEKGDISGKRYRRTHTYIFERKMGPPPLEEMPRHRPVELPLPPDQIFKDLEKYKQIAIELGADDAKIISARDIPQDPRVRIKCAVPQCQWYRSSTMCPPHFKIPWEEAKAILQAYNWAIVFRMCEEPSDITGPLGREKNQKRLERLRLVVHVCDTIESEAYYDGHVFAVGMTGGPCKEKNCHDFPVCAQLQGKPCRFPFRAKPSENCLYINSLKMLEKVGWKHTLAGFCVWPEDAPKDHHFQSIGLILIE